MMSDTLVLIRWADHEDHGVLGEIYHDGAMLCKTIERPWLFNQPFVSCIPDGTYNLEPFTRTNGDEVYCLTNSALGITREQEEGSERFAILIHKANWMTDLAGCVAPGESYGFGPDSQGHTRMMVRNSSAATKKLFAYIQQHHISKIALVWKTH